MTQENRADKTHTLTIQIVLSINGNTIGDSDGWVEYLNGKSDAMEFQIDKNLRGLTVNPVLSNPLAWSKGRVGWVTLHNDELHILKILMQSLKEPNLEEVRIAAYQDGKKRTYHRLYVKDLLMAYEIINMARLTALFR